MSYYPINLDLKNRKCVVIGGGAVAERKVETLLEFGAAVLVVSPEMTPGLRQMCQERSIETVDGVYHPKVLDGAFVVFAATDDREVNKAVSDEAQRRGLLINVVDDPELCNFIVPAVVRRGDLIISISTSGQGPALARRIREKLEEYIGPEYGDLAELFGEIRGEVKARYPDMAERNKAYIRILDSDVLDLLAQGKREEALEKARKCI